MHELDFFDVRMIDEKSTSIILDNGELQEISVNQSNGMGVRALYKGYMGFVSGNACDNKSDIDKAVKSASILAKGIKRLSTPRMSKQRLEKNIELAPFEKKNIKKIPKVKINPADISIEDKVEFLKEIERKASLDEVKSTTVTYFESSAKIKYNSSEGQEFEYELMRTGIFINAVAIRDGIYQAGFESKASIGGYELFKKYDAYELAELAGISAVELLNAKQAKGGNLPVILDPALAGVFIHEAVGHAAEADLVLEGDSILKDKIGEKIASPLISVIDDPTLYEYGFSPIDVEGVESQKTTIVKDGVLKSYLHSRETASHFKSDPGHSRAQGISQPLVRMSNTYIDSGDSKFEEMLEEIKNGLYLIGSRGGQVNTGEGVFQFNAKKGYVIENGELKGLLRDVSLSGNTLEILDHITMVGDDLTMHSGHCGKGGQTVPVSDGSPHILISKALIGGV